jgi:hypothetical protein
MTCSRSLSPCEVFALQYRKVERVAGRKAANQSAVSGTFTNSVIASALAYAPTPSAFLPVTSSELL